MRWWCPPGSGGTQGSEHWCDFSSPDHPSLEFQELLLQLYLIKNINKNFLLHVSLSAKVWKESWKSWLLWLFIFNVTDRLTNITKSKHPFPDLEFNLRMILSRVKWTMFLARRLLSSHHQSQRVKNYANWNNSCMKIRKTLLKEKKMFVNESFLNAQGSIVQGAIYIIHSTQ